MEIDSSRLISPLLSSGASFWNVKQWRVLFLQVERLHEFMSSWKPRRPSDLWTLLVTLLHSQHWVKGLNLRVFSSLKGEFMLKCCQETSLITIIIVAIPFCDTRVAKITHFFSSLDLWSFFFVFFYYLSIFLFFSHSLFLLKHYKNKKTDNQTNTM